MLPMPLPPIATTYLSDAAFPASLRNLAVPPQQLYHWGDLNILNSPCISVVGSRAISAYAERVLECLIPPLVRAGITVVSGLAYGVDAYAQKLALQAGGLVTAVLGSGLHRMYPAAHTNLALEIVSKGGLVCSEFAPEIGPQKAFFPQRNRIVAGLSKVTLIIEAAAQSGTSITARFALEAGREVAVVPGDIFAQQSAGVHELLKQGAHPITTPRDILDLYGMTEDSLAATPEKRASLTDDQITLYDFMSSGGVSFEDLHQHTGFSISYLQSILSLLELEGIIYFKADQWHRIL